MKITRKLFWELARYAASCGFVLATKILITWVLLRFAQAQVAYFLAHIVVFFVSYLTHATFSFRATFSTGSLWSYFKAVIGFKIIDYLVFTVLFTALGIEALWAVGLATISVALFRFVAVRKSFGTGSDDSTSSENPPCC